MTSLRKLLKQKGFDRIAIQKLSTGHYQLHASVNNETGIFILDTGASSSCICLDNVLAFKLNVEETEFKAAGAGATEMETKVAKKNRLQIGTNLLHKVDFVLFSMIHVNNALAQAGEKPVDGILGADVLKKLHAVIDYGTNSVYFKK